MKITCSEMSQDGYLPARYCALEGNINPTIYIKNLPAKTVSLAVVMESFDTDGHSQIHWVAYNIPATNQIHENENRGETGKNDFGAKGYWGPTSDELVKCSIRVYAMDRFFDFPSSVVSKFDVEGKVRFYGLGYGKIICNSATTNHGLYSQSA